MEHITIDPTAGAETAARVQAEAAQLPAEPAIEGYRPVYRVTASLLDRPVTIPAPASAQDIAEAVQDALDAQDYFDIEVDVDLMDGTATIRDSLESVLLDTATVTGPGVGQPTEPDYWTTLADDLVQAAERIRTLAGTPAPTDGSSANLYVTSGLLARTAEYHRAIVDRVAAAFGAQPEVKRVSARWELCVIAEVGRLGVHAYAPADAPEDAELATLRARVAELEAQQVAGGAR